MDSVVKKDLVLLGIGLAVGVIPWALDKASVEMSKPMLFVVGIVSVALLAWGLTELISNIEPKKWHRITLSPVQIVALCCFVLFAFWWGIKLFGSAQTTTATAPPSRPDLRLFVDGGNVFVPNDPPETTGLALNAKVWNLGAPGVAIEWDLSIIPQGRLPVIGQITKIPEHLRLGGSVNSAVVSGNESLVDKTSQTDISRTPVSGVLLFYVPINHEDVLLPSTRMELTVGDAYGNQTKFTKLIGDWLVR